MVNAQQRTAIYGFIICRYWPQRATGQSSDTLRQCNMRACCIMVNFDHIHMSHKPSLIN